MQERRGMMVVRSIDEILNFNLAEQYIRGEHPPLKNGGV